MCTWSPATSSPEASASLTAASASSATSPNFDSAWAVRIARCVSASMPGVTRTSTVRTPADFARATSSSASMTTIAPGLGRRLELFVRLVVAVEQDLLAPHPCAQRELELTARGDVGPQTLRGEEPEQRDVGERLRPVHDERFRIDSRIRARPGENGLPAVHEERRAELLSEGRRTDSAHHELAVVDGCRVGEELDQPVSRSTTPEPFRRRPGRCSARRRSGTRHPRRPLPCSASCPCGREPRPTA